MNRRKSIGSAIVINFIIILIFIKESRLSENKDSFLICFLNLQSTVFVGFGIFSYFKRHYALYHRHHYYHRVYRYPFGFGDLQLHGHYHLKYHHHFIEVCRHFLCRDSNCDFSSLESWNIFIPLSWSFISKNQAFSMITGITNLNSG